MISVKCLFVLEIEVHGDKKKGVLGPSQKVNLVKRYSTHASKPTLAPIVMGDRYGNFRCPRTNIRSIKWKFSVWFGYQSLNSTQERTHPDIAHVYRMFWQKSSLDIDHWNGVKNVLQFLQSFMCVMLSNKEQVLSNSCGYKDRTSARCVAKSIVVANIPSWSLIVEKLQTNRQLWYHQICIPIV